MTTVDNSSASTPATGRVVAIIDDDDAVRQSTAGLLKRAGYRVKSYTSGSEFLASDLHPDLCCILLEMRMPGIDGLAVLRALREREVSLPVLVLTGHGDVPMAVEAMRLGAMDFIEKPCLPAALVDTIRRACSEPVPVTATHPIDKRAQAKVSTLSNRQRSVLLGIMNGQPNKIVAWELGLSIRTVEAYRAQMFVKLGVRGTAELVRLAMAAGLAI